MPQPIPTPKSVMALGSGFFISGDGYIVTNNHVVEHELNVEVTTDNDKVYAAKVMATDPQADVVLLKVEGSDFPYVSSPKRRCRLATGCSPSAIRSGLAARFGPIRQPSTLIVVSHRRTETE